MNIEDYFIRLFGYANTVHFYVIKENVVFMITISSRLMLGMSGYKISESFYEKVYEHIDLSSSKFTNSSIIRDGNIDFLVIYSITGKDKRLGGFENKIDILRKTIRINNIDKLLEADL